MRKDHREQLCKNCVGAGERRSSGACKHCLQNLISVFQLLMIGQLWKFTSTLTSIIWFRARRVYQTCRACETFLHRTFRRFDIWHFDTRKSFSGSERGGGWIEIFEKMLKGSLLLSSRCFFARSLLHCSLAFLPRLHWPTAWHRLKTPSWRARKALVEGKHETLLF